MVKQTSPKNASCLVYSVGQDLVVVCHYEVSLSSAFDWTTALLGGLVPERVVVLTSFVEAEFRSEDRDPQHRLLPPMLRKLQTRGASSLVPPVCEFLEAPNIVNNAGAAVLSHVSSFCFGLYFFFFSFLNRSGFVIVSILVS